MQAAEESAPQESLAASSSNADTAPGIEDVNPPKPVAKRCSFDEEDGDWVNTVRESTHEGLCMSAMWLDGLFGDEHEFNDRDFTGKLSLGVRLDNHEDVDPRLRVRINTRLPNLSQSFNAFLGRVDRDSYLSNTEVDEGRVNAVGLRSATGRDDDQWLVGLGYRNPNSRENGFDFSVGAKLSSGISGYAKITHRALFKKGDSDFWRTTQTGFWRRDDGFGFSSRLDYTKFLTDRDIFEWDNTFKHTEESSQWEWVTGTSWHHSFSENRGVSSRLYVRGEQESEVSIPEFGATFVYVRPFLKPWLFIEAGVDLRFEKEDQHASYETNVRYGIELEILLGDYYGRKNRASKRRKKK